MSLVKGTSPHDLPTEFDSLVRILPPSAIPDKVAYENAMEMIDALASLPNPSPGQLLYLETLSILVEAYESENYAIDTSKVSPLDSLKHLIEAHEMSASALGNLLGERSLGSKILCGTREMSKSHIRILAKYFKVSTDMFL